MHQRHTRAPTAVAFKGLSDKIYALWVGMGEGAFAAYFFKTYVTAPWKKWYLGATPPGCCSGGQQLIENRHGSDKKMIGTAALKAVPVVFINETLWKIMNASGKKLDDHPVDEVGHEGGAPLNASNVLQAQLYLSSYPTGKGPIFELPTDDDGNRYYAANVVGVARPMTQVRARAYASFYDFGDLPPGNVDKDYYKAIHADVLKYDLIALKPVTDKSELPPWARGSLAACTSPTGEASCGAPNAAAVHLATRPTAQRKGVAAIFGDIKRSMANNKPLRYHKHKVLVGDGSEGAHFIVGYVKTAVSVGTPLDGQQQVWNFVIKFLDEDNMPDEAWNPEQLAQGLWLAANIGCSGVV
ncbi:hypothetical protein M885DRAFT_502703 [Pelagophyceae sp. CCMP2097]|nr:hypothetical protein M885DRAFT_502703 [Pelagophyceae sp. CCMP2097]